MRGDTAITPLSFCMRHFRIKNFLRIIVIFLISSITGIVYAADTSIVSVTAVVLSKNNCKFTSNTATLSFGNLDPANPIDRNANTSIIFKCGGKDNNVTFFISDDDGLYETGPNANRMRHTTIATEYLPYSFTLNPTTGTVPRNTDQTLTISGTVMGNDYQDASVGAYSDTVVISIVP